MTATASAQQSQGWQASARNRAPRRCPSTVAWPDTVIGQVMVQFDVTCVVAGLLCTSPA